jgi:hypothetical protein
MKAYFRELSRLVREFTLLAKQVLSNFFGSEPLIETIRQRDTLWIGGFTNVSWTNKAASGRATPDGD